MLKILSKYEQRHFVRPIYYFLHPVPPAFVLDDCAGGFAREFWWTNQEFSPADIIPPWFSMHIYHLGMNNRPAGGHSSETQSHPINMNNEIELSY
jgi:hypothetical protein